jgi:RimJ/RimL family protein N-acetyltransferase
MPTGLLFECDETVANWLFQRNNWPIYKYDKAIGLVNEEGNLIGAVLLQHWNGNNIELSYYGRNTLSLGVIRCLARYLLSSFSPARVTVTTRKKNRSLIRSLQKLGFRLEGMMRCFYGLNDCNRNTGVRFVMFRADIEKLAKTPIQAVPKCL